MYIYVCICMYICIYVYVCMCVYMYIYICMFVYIHVCMYIEMYVYFLHVCRNVVIFQMSPKVSSTATVQSKYWLLRKHPLNSDDGRKKILSFFRQ
jgi:hypothetical protein